LAAFPHLKPEGRRAADEWWPRVNIEGEGSKFSSLSVRPAAALPLGSEYSKTKKEYTKTTVPLRLSPAAKNIELSILAYISIFYLPNMCNERVILSS
jgi:hypothetical protein